MTVVVSRGYAWIADKSGLAHATLDRGRRLRTLCGIKALDERYAWPAVVKCASCQERVDGVAR